QFTLTVHYRYIIKKENIQQESVDPEGSVEVKASSILGMNRIWNELKHGYIMVLNNRSHQKRRFASHEQEDQTKRGLLKRFLNLNVYVMFAKAFSGSIIAANQSFIDLQLCLKVSLGEICDSDSYVLIIELFKAWTSSELIKPPYQFSGYKFPKSDVYLAEIGEEIANQLEKEKRNKLRKLQAQHSKEEGNFEINLEAQVHESKNNEDVVLGSTSSDIKKEEKVDIISSDVGRASGIINAAEFVDTPDVPLRDCEKKKQSEWALMKRHVSEDIFGVQLCGCKAQHLVKCAEVLSNEIEVDFVDINLGCPIDLVFNKGGGTALLRHDGRIGKIIRGMQRVMDFPVTVKFRTGIQDNMPVAHKLMPKFESWGVALATVSTHLKTQKYFQEFVSPEI
ncbi:5480_t:CDS:2, partial [Acaulospora colombiana]